MKKNLIAFALLSIVAQIGATQTFDLTLNSQQMNLACSNAVPRLLQVRRQVPFEQWYDVNRANTAVDQVAGYDEVARGTIYSYGFADEVVVSQFSESVVSGSGRASSTPSLGTIFEFTVSENTWVWVEAYASTGGFVMGQDATKVAMNRIRLEAEGTHIWTVGNHPQATHRDFVGFMFLASGIRYKMIVASVANVTLQQGGRGSAWARSFLFMSFIFP